MKNSTRYVLTAACAFVFGVIATAILSANASPVFLRVIQVGVLHDLESLAAQAHARQDYLSEYAHRRSIVSLTESEHQDLASRAKSIWTVSFPLSALVLRRIDQGHAEGTRRLFGIQLARLALSMEAVGIRGEAQKVWGEAAQMLGHNDVSRARELATSLDRVDAGVHGQ